MFQGVYEPDGRFEPIGSPFFEGGYLFSQCGLLLKQALLLVQVFILRDSLVEFEVEEAIELCFATSQCGFRLFEGELASLRIFGGFLLEFGNDAIGCVGLNENAPQSVANLILDYFFPNVALGARAFALGATKIVVALLGFGCDEAAALAAKEHSAIQVWFEGRAFGFALALKNGLHVIKELLGDDWLVFAFVKLAFEVNHAVIDGAFEHPVIFGNGEGFVAPSGQACCVHSCADFGEAEIAGGVELECLANERGFALVDDNAAVFTVVEVSERCPCRPNAVAELLTHSSLDVLRKVVHVVFALAERDVQHEFAIGRVLEAERGKFEVNDCADVDEVDDASAIQTVSRKAVGMPRENALCLALLDFRQHFVENRSPRLLGGSAFDELSGYRDSLAFGQLAEFVKLGREREDLAACFVGRFAGVEKKFY